MIALMLAASLVGAGCAEDSNQSADESPGGDSGDKGALAMSFPTNDVSVWNDQLEIMRTLIEDAGYEFLTDNPAWDIQTQVSDWEAWVARGNVKAIMGFPVQADSMVAVTAQAAAAGIPVIGYAGGWEGTAHHLELDLLGAGQKVGEAAGAWINETYGDEPVEVGLLADTTADLGRVQAQGIREGLAAAGSNVTIYEIEASSREQGYQGAQSTLVAHPEVKVWLGIGADMVLGARQAAIDAGAAPDDPNYYVSASDSAEELYELIASGVDMLREAYVFAPQVLAETNAGLLIAAAEGNLGPEESTLVGVTHVTKENAADFLSQ
ncbi:MAG: substrate-binding domain-containing protein [Bifidobacteriaceae bacterium]|nr:substrate-binding domain-containing protein [Bifidobacteriaceae bacterium]